MRSEWNFDTVKSVAALGTFRGTANDLSLPPGMVAEDDDESVYDADGHDSIDTGGATKGSDPLVSSGLGMNADAAHSTVIIKTPRVPENLDTNTEETPPGTNMSYVRLHSLIY